MSDQKKKLKMSEITDIFEVFLLFFSRGDIHNHVNTYSRHSGKDWSWLNKIPLGCCQLTLRDFQGTRERDREGRERERDRGKARRKSESEVGILTEMNGFKACVQDYVITIFMYRV